MRYDPFVQPASQSGDAQEVELELCDLRRVLVGEGHPFFLGGPGYHTSAAQRPS